MELAVRGGAHNAGGLSVWDDALVVDLKTNEKLHRSVRNLAKFDVAPPEGLNLESILRRKAVVLTTAAAKALEGQLS